MLKTEIFKKKSGQKGMPDKLIHFGKYSNISRHYFSNVRHRSILFNSEYSVLIPLSEILILIGVSKLLVSRFCLNKFCWLHPTSDKLTAWVFLPCRSLLKKGFVSSCR